MMFLTLGFLVLAAFRVRAYPHSELKQTLPFEIPISKRRVTHSIEPTLTSRANKELCTTLELPTESSYNTGYEAFCNTYVIDDRAVRMGPGADPLVATYMLKTHIGTEIPWIFKISSTAWGAKPYWLTRARCLSGFKDMLEGENAKLGTNYCVVDESGGNGESKDFSGQGHVLVMGDEMTWSTGDVNQISIFETRRRKGKFDLNNLDGKKK